MKEKRSTINDLRPKSMISQRQHYYTHQRIRRVICVVTMIMMQTTTLTKPYIRPKGTVVSAAAAAAAVAKRYIFPSIVAFIPSSDGVVPVQRKVSISTTSTTTATRTQGSNVPFIPSTTTIMRSINPQQQTRLFHSNSLNNNYNNNNDNDDSTIVGQIKNVAKRFLPAKWFQSEEERQQMIRQQQVQKEINSSIQQIVKDAPLPIRMLSSMISPMFGSMMSSLAETVSSQQDLVDAVYNNAIQVLQNDPSIRNEFGNNPSIGRPFSQSSSSSSINGISSSRVELAFPISGQYNTGVCRLVAKSGTSSNNNKNPPMMIDLLQVQLNSNGRVIDVNPVVVVGQRASGQYDKSYYNDNNIIDAEIIEKDTKNKY